MRASTIATVWWWEHPRSGQFPYRTCSFVFICGRRRSWLVGVFQRVMNPAARVLTQTNKYDRESWHECSLMSCTSSTFQNASSSSTASTSTNACMVYHQNMWWIYAGQFLQLLKDVIVCSHRREDNLMYHVQKYVKMAFSYPGPSA